MNKKIETPTVGEILREEFMDPLGISSYALAKSINVPASRIQDILHDRRKITADTSLRLAKYFGVSDRYFLNLQNDINLRTLKKTMHTELASISTFARI
ncbi:MAG: HigA family addiction module antitoxin [Eubacteriales bacterium]|nr:HigA family addiction module antitoxin [Eubacteriales bacterium]